MIHIFTATALQMVWTVHNTDPMTLIPNKSHEENTLASECPFFAARIFT